MAKLLKIRMNVSIAGTLPCGSQYGYQPGQIVLVDAALAEAWIGVGHAEKADKTDAITETAALSNNDFLEHDPRLLERMNGVMPV